MDIFYKNLPVERGFRAVFWVFEDGIPLSKNVEESKNLTRKAFSYILEARKGSGEEVFCLMKADDLHENLV